MIKRKSFKHRQKCKNICSFQALDVQTTTNLTSCHLLVGFENDLVLWLGHVVALGVETALRVGGVVDDLQLALLVIVAVSAVKDAICVSCLVTELTVISGKRKVFMSK